MYQLELKEGSKIDDFLNGYFRNIHAIETSLFMGTIDFITCQEKVKKELMYYFNDTEKFLEVKNEKRK